MGRRGTSRPRPTRAGHRRGRRFQVRGGATDAVLSNLRRVTFWRAPDTPSAPWSADGGAPALPWLLVDCSDAALGTPTSAPEPPSRLDARLQGSAAAIRTDASGAVVAFTIRVRVRAPVNGDGAYQFNDGSNGFPPSYDTVDDWPDLAAAPTSSSSSALAAALFGPRVRPAIRTSRTRISGTGSARCSTTVSTRSGSRWCVPFEDPAADADLLGSGGLAGVRPFVSEDSTRRDPHSGRIGSGRRPRERLPHRRERRDPLAAVRGGDLFEVEHPTSTRRHSSWFRYRRAVLLRPTADNPQRLLPRFEVGYALKGGPQLPDGSE